MSDAVKISLPRAGAIDKMEFAISVASSRHSTNWSNIKVTWSQLRRKLSTPVVTSESVDEYLSMPHDVQANIKDVGGFVGGVVQGGRRIRGSVPFRQILSLDLDSTKLPIDGMWYKLSDVWEFRFILHTTRSYTFLTPRYRIIIPLSRLVDAVEYEAIGRYIASLHDVNEFDPSTYQNTRLMYYPSRSSDGFFACKESACNILDVDAVLATYSDYTDPSQWAYGYNDSPHANTELQKAQDPLLKGGIVGAFCKAYPIRELLEVQLSAYYKMESNGRYTYIGGSSSGGVVVYDDRWCYSHHSTDPNRGLLLNAFDLYRLVMFGALDHNTPKQTKVDNMPSYTAMVDFCNKDARVQQYYITDEARDLSIFAKVADASDGNSDVDSADDAWLIELMTELDKHPKTGAVECTLNNYVTILDKDPHLCSNLQYDTFTNKISVLGQLPWQRDTKEWSDSDDASARIYISNVYGFKPNTSYYNDAFLHVINKDANRIDSGRNFIKRCDWDGKPRAEQLFITTLGVSDTPLNRAQTLIWLKALVARQIQPGIKFDNMLVLSGSEGIGKSSVFRLLVGDDFFTDSFNFGWQSQKMYEAIEGKLIVESAELDGFDKKEAEAVKAFLSSSTDRHRKAYARRATDVPRRCVFAGTTNQVEVLRSQTGNRRMWIMMCNKDAIITPVWELLTPDYIDQIWAEVIHKYKEDKRLYLPNDMVELQRAQQKEFTQEDPLALEVIQFCKIWLPEEWNSMPISARRMYINTIKQGNSPMRLPAKRRETVSAVEFIREWMGLEVDNKTQYLSKQINTAIRGTGTFADAGHRRDSMYGRLVSFFVPDDINGTRIDFYEWQNKDDDLPF